MAAKNNKNLNCDVLIAGGGIVGLALAACLKKDLGEAVSVFLCDPGFHAPKETQRASAIASDGQQLLARCGAWAGVEARAQPILSMKITDSDGRSKVKPVLLSFDSFDPKAGDGAPLAHMIFHHDLENELRQLCNLLGVRQVTSDVANFASSRDFTDTKLSNGDLIKTRLLVAADGAKSRLRSQARIGTTGWHYKQSAIVATVKHERPHNGCARENFLPGGVLAILPLTCDRSSIVWALDTAECNRLLKLSAGEFQKQLARNFGEQLGQFEVLGKPQSFPLGVQIARTFVAKRFALAGDAAHVIHPLAGQGLNLGLRDAAALAHEISNDMRLGLDPGGPRVLANYQTARRLDAVTLAILTGGLNRLFSNDLITLRLIRDIGLGLVDRTPAVKRVLSSAAQQGSSKFLGGAPSRNVEFFSENPSFPGSGT